LGLLGLKESLVR
jgi:hypothetical protein